MTEEKKEVRKKTEAEKKQQQEAMIHLWMNNLDEKAAEQETPPAVDEG